METLKTPIVPYTEAYREQLLTVWEKSVVATHHFLKQEDFLSIRTIVHSLDFGSFDLYCAMKDDRVAGFIGVSEQKVEMLFLDPEYFGKGIGKELMQFAVEKLQANKVDVNAQNTGAVEFYQKLGFETVERTEKDDQGYDYPLLRMQLKNENKYK